MISIVLIQTTYVLHTFPDLWKIGTLEDLCCYMVKCILQNHNTYYESPNYHIHRSTPSVVLDE
jgi:hypothetical protein